MSKQQILDAPVKLVEFGLVEAGLAELRKELAGVQFDVATTEGNKAARAARQRCVSIRTSADTAYGDWNKPMLDKQRMMRAKLTEIKNSVKEIEDPIDAQIKAEEKRKADEKAERERIEAERRAAIQSDIDDIKNMAITNVGKPSAVLAAAVEACHDIEITLERFSDRAGEAEITKQQTLAQLQQMHEAALAHESEQEKLATERAELERLRKEQEQRDAEARAIAAKQEAERQAAITKQQAELKAQQDEIDRQKKELADAQAAAELKEQQRLAAIEAKAQAKRDAEAKAAKDKADAEAAEVARRERVQFEENGPGQEAIIQTLAQHYQVSEGAVIKWLSSMSFSGTTLAQTQEST